MRTWRRAPLAVAAGAALLVAGAACTEDGPDRPEDSPRPLPTAFDGELPPGVGGDPLRHLHGPGAEGPGILDDQMGVRVSSVGAAFLISSNSEERHVMLGAEDGEILWQGTRHIQRFGLDADGSQVLIADDRDGGTHVVDDNGETVWRGSSGRDVFIGGMVVRRPAGWSADDPYGDYTVHEPGGGELWDYSFDEPPEDTSGNENGEEASPTAEPGPGDPAQEGQAGAAPVPAPDPDRYGVPVAARDDVLLLDDGAGLLQARGIGPDNTGDLLWSVPGDDTDLAGEDAVPRPRPQVVGSYGMWEEQSEEDVGAEDASPSDDPAEGTASPGATPGEGTGQGAGSPAVLVRWSAPEEPSVLALHDLHGGEILWSLTEPGANPGGDEFAPSPLPGALHEPVTGTVLLPQATGETPLTAVDLAEGEVRWELEDEDEQAISPALAMGGYVYGDTRAAEESSTDQVVLDAEDKDVAAEGLGAYVEAATDDGYSVVVSGRQRFVFPPADDAPAGGESNPPE